jgi:NADH-quinone oxidoreductase subunit E
MLGRARVAAGIAARLGIGPGETSADGRFTLLPIVCLGACDRAPVMMIGDVLHGNVDDARLDSLLEPV